MLHRTRLRLAQVAAHFSTPVTVDLPELLDVLLTTLARERFRSLPASDQRHLIQVATSLAQAGASSNTVTAGLLHDIGKWAPGVPIRLHHRVAKVVLETVHPGTLNRLRKHSAPPRGLTALWILACHPRHGAELAAEWGYPERVAWLIGHHEDTSSSDPDLRLLIEADAGRLQPESARMLPYG